VGMQQDVLAEYRRLRAEYFNYGAKHCLELARYQAKSLVWDYSRRMLYDREALRETEWTEGLLTFRVYLVPDDGGGMDLDDLGRFEGLRRRASKYENRPEREAVWLDFASGGRDYTQGWFVPEYGVGKRMPDNRRRGMSRHDAYVLARKQVRDDAERYAGYYEDDWQYVGVCARAYINAGTKDEMEVGQADVWGVDFDGKDYSYVSDVARDEARMAAQGAKDAVFEALDEAVGVMLKAHRAITKLNMQAPLADFLTHDWMAGVGDSVREVVMWYLGHKQAKGEVIK